MPDKQRQGRLGKFVEWTGPGMQVDLLIFMKAAQAVVKLTDGETGGESAIKFR